MNFFKNIAVLGLVYVLLIGCSADTPLASENVGDSDPSVKDATAQTYQKPGASVQFDHNYDGYTEVDESENISLRFKEQYPAGVLTISLSSKDGLQIDSDLLSESFSMTDAEYKVMDVAVSASEEGKYYLNIFASVDDGNGAQSRVFGLAVNVGEVSDKTTDNEDAVSKENFRGEPMIMMPAQETISN